MITVRHPHGGGNLAFLYLSLCLYVFCPPPLIEGVRGSCILFEINKNAGICVFISLSSVYH